MSGEAFTEGEVRTGPAYEAVRTAERTGLAAAAEGRRVALGDDLVLVFETRDTVRGALEESLRSERLGGPEEVASETAAFAGMLASPDALAATLYVDVADPVALADRLAQLTGIAGAVFLEVAGQRVAARGDSADAGTGAFRLVFAPDGEQRRHLAGGGQVRAVCEHPRCRAEVGLSPEQVHVIAADLGG